MPPNEPIDFVEEINEYNREYGVKTGQMNQFINQKKKEMQKGKR